MATVHDFSSRLKNARRDGDYRQLPAIPWKAAGLVYVGTVFSGFGEIVL